MNSLKSAIDPMEQYNDILVGIDSFMGVLIQEIEFLAKEIQQSQLRKERYMSVLKDIQAFRQEKTVNKQGFNPGPGYDPHGRENARQYDATGEVSSVDRAGRRI